MTTADVLLDLLTRWKRVAPDFSPSVHPEKFAGQIMFIWSAGEADLCIEIGDEHTPCEWRTRDWPNGGAHVDGGEIEDRFGPGQPVPDAFFDCLRQLAARRTT